MACLERLVGAPRGTEQRFELGREHAADGRLTVVPRHRHAIGPVAEVRQVEFEAAVVVKPNELAQLVGLAGLAVRRQTHHLELVAVLGEAEVLRDGEVQDPQ